MTARGYALQTVSEASAIHPHLGSEGLGRARARAYSQVDSSGEAVEHLLEWFHPSISARGPAVQGDTRRCGSAVSWSPATADRSFWLECTPHQSHLRRWVWPRTMHLARVA